MFDERLKLARKREGLSLRDLDRCFAIGDSERDVESGKRFGCKTILVLTGLSTRSDAEGFSMKPDHIAEDLQGAVRCHPPAPEGRAETPPKTA